METHRQLVLRREVEGKEAQERIDKLVSVQSRVAELL